jgi:hypothetical protein
MGEMSLLRLEPFGPSWPAFPAHHGLSSHHFARHGSIKSLTEADSPREAQAEVPFTH